MLVIDNVNSKRFNIGTYLEKRILKEWIDTRWVVVNNENNTINHGGKTHEKIQKILTTVDEKGGKYKC